MKRSPLRRHKPISRGCSIRRARSCRRPSIPRHHDKDVREEYRDANPGCEWKKYLGLDFGEPYHGYVKRDDFRHALPPETNHIFTNPKRDLWPIFCRLSKINHDWFHEHIDEGRVFCLLVKCMKNEADLPLWNKAFGKDVTGWAAGLQFCDHRAETFRRVLLNHLLQLERAAA